MKFKRGLDERMPAGELVLYGLQWLAISLPGVVIVGGIVGQLQFPEPTGQIIYLQKLFFVTAVTLIIQLLFGHRLPLVLGPAAVLLIGVVASQGHDLPTIYSSVMIGGTVLALLSFLGFFPVLQRLFTPRVVALVLLLIAFTLAAPIMNLLTGSRSGGSPLSSLVFAMALLLGMFLLHRWLRGPKKAVLIVVAMVVGSLAFYALFPDLSPEAQVTLPWIGHFGVNITSSLRLDPGVLVSFLCCYLALAINDLGSIQSIGEVVRAQGMEGRVRRGITVTGLANLLSGWLGVIGPVNFSLSPGVVMATGCASRYALLPTGLVLLVLAFSPAALVWLAAIPAVVMGSVLLYILCAQVAAGMLLAFEAPGGFIFEDGLILGLPLLLGTIISFLPEAALLSMPSVLRPILGNGFVVGVTAVMLLEHVILPETARR